MEKTLQQLLSQRKKQYFTDSKRLSSAVLVPLYRKDGEYNIVFIQRTMTVKAHKGQISFPGGTRDKVDKTLLDTALREAEEEIGLQRRDVTVLGELDDEMTTTSNFIVTPFLAKMPWPYRFKINRDEVDKVLSVPIKALLDKDCLKPDFETLEGKKIESFAYHYRGTIIWGATARILNKILVIIEKNVR